MRKQNGQCRSCPRNCKRRAKDHLIPLGPSGPGKVVGGRDPRARRPATSRESCANASGGVLRSVARAGGSAASGAKRQSSPATACDGLFVRRRASHVHVRNPSFPCAVAPAGAHHSDIRSAIQRCIAVRPDACVVAIIDARSRRGVAAKTATRGSSQRRPAGRTQARQTRRAKPHGQTCASPCY